MVLTCGLCVAKSGREVIEIKCPLNLSSLSHPLSDDLENWGEHVNIIRSSVFNLSGEWCMK